MVQKLRMILKILGILVLFILFQKPKQFVRNFQFFIAHDLLIMVCHADCGMSHQVHHVQIGDIEGFADGRKEMTESVEGTSDVIFCRPLGKGVGGIVR